MKVRFGHQPTRQRGQGMMEYIIIVALIAVAAIGVYSAFGTTVRNQSAGLAQELAGRSGSQQVTNARDASDSAAGRANNPNRRGMGRYSTENDQN
jgi:Flp pilus assembly pilin Flp